VEERELVSLIETEVSNSIGQAGGQLANERAMELDYYNSQPLGNERVGESQVVSSDVFDAVEGMLPHLLKTFTASDDAVEFEPEGLEDEEAAKQRTDACNYVFYRQNNGFVLMYEWFKDALIQKNGIVKYWWDESEEVTEDEYEGLTEGEYMKLVNDESVEVLAHTAYDDPDALEQKKDVAQRLSQQGAPPEMLAQLEAAPFPQLHDLEIKTTKDTSKICIEAIPPEEFGISSKHKCISIQQTPFCYHKTKMTISALRAMGCPEKILEELGSPDDDIGRPEVLARDRFTDDNSNSDTIDDSTKEVDVTDCFIRIDYDGDGVAELRHIIMPGRKIWINEKSSHINYAAITPIIMPHRWVGKSIAEIVMDVQFTTSVLWRQMLNNLYLTNNPQKVVLGSAGGVIQADLDRLMTSRVGGILVEYQPNAIRNQEVPFVAGASFPMIEYMQGVKENRTGNTRYNQGTDADSLNKTARGIAMIQSAAQQKLDLIARIFAETGVKDLFRGIAYFLSKYSSKAMTIRLRNKWVDIDPRSWKTQFDMTVNVGLGTGNKDAQLVHLSKVAEMQLALMESGRGYMVTDQNVYNLYKKTTENMGFKHPDLFITDPAQVQKPPPQPNPDMIKIQAEAQEAQAKIKSNETIRQFDAQTQKEVEGIKSQTLIAIEQMRIAAQESLKKMELHHQEQLAIFEANNDKQGPVDDSALKEQQSIRDAQIEVFRAELDAATKKQIADLDAATKLQIAQMTAAQKAVSEEKKPEKPEKQDNTEVLTALAAIAENTAKKPKKYVVKETKDGHEITVQ